MEVKLTGSYLELDVSMNYLPEHHTQLPFSRNL